MDVMEFNPVRRENTRGWLLGKDEIGAAPDFLSGFKCSLRSQDRSGLFRVPHHPIEPHCLEKLRWYVKSPL